MLLTFIFWIIYFAILIWWYFYLCLCSAYAMYLYWYLHLFIVILVSVLSLCGMFYVLDLYFLHSFPFSSDFLLSKNFPWKILYAFLVSLSILYSVRLHYLTLLCGLYKTWSSPLYNISECPIFFPHRTIFILLFNLIDE